MVGADNGISSNNDAIDVKTALTVTSFLAIALYNVVELNFIILATFKQRRGLYFWSFVVATWAIAPCAVGFLIKYLQLSNLSTLYVTLIVLGWSAMVTGQSVVLYSRLHLVDRNRTRLRLVLTMIIVNAVICHIPIIVMVYGANGPNPGPYVLPYSIYEKVQVTIFFLQELTISGLYILATTRLFRLDGDHYLHGSAVSKTLRHLILVNVVVICLDITVLGLEYAGYYDLQTAYKILVYSIKLKLEFNILNGLVRLTRAGGVGSGLGGDRSNYTHHSSRTRTAVVTSAVGGSAALALDTFDGRGRTADRKGGLDRDSPGSGAYNAYAYAMAGDKVDKAYRNGMFSSDGITVTTKVDIIPDEQDGATAERCSLDMSASELRMKSSSSSEVGFARKPY